MPKILDHAHFDMAEKALIQRIANRYRDNLMSKTRCIREIVMLGYERASVERYVDILDSTCEKVDAYRAPASLPYWERQFSPHRW